MKRELAVPLSLVVPPLHEQGIPQNEAVCPRW